MCIPYIFIAIPILGFNQLISLSVLFCHDEDVIRRHFVYQYDKEPLKIQSRILHRIYSYQFKKHCHNKLNACLCTNSIKIALIYKKSAVPFRGPPRYNPRRRSGLGWGATLSRIGGPPSPCPSEHPFSSASSSLSEGSSSHRSHEDDISIVTGIKILLLISIKKCV